MEPIADISKEQIDLNGNQNHIEGLTLELDQYKETNQDLLNQLDFIKKRYSGLQDELQSTLLAQSKLEGQFYKVESELDQYKLKEQEATKQVKALTFKINRETKEFEKDKNKFSEQEELHRSQLKELHNHYQQKLANSSPGNSSSQRHSRSRSVSVNFSPPTYLDNSTNDLNFEDNTEGTLAHEAQLANRTIRQQLKDIAELKATNSQLKEQFNRISAQEAFKNQKIGELELEVDNLKLNNDALMEDIESYQLLLQEKTLKGQFSLLGRNNSTGSLDEDDDDTHVGFNLGSELAMLPSDNDTEVDDSTQVDPSLVKGLKDEVRQLKDDVRQAKDENKALALYINKILAKIMSNPALAEAITVNGDSRSERDGTKFKKDSQKLKQKVRPAPIDSQAKPKPGRFGNFLSPTFNITGFTTSTAASTSTAEPTTMGMEDGPVTATSINLVSSPVPRVSFDSVTNKENVNVRPTLTTFNPNPTVFINPASPTDSTAKPDSEFSSRSRRSLSVSVANLDKTASTNKEGDESVSAPFSFRNAFKKILQPSKPVSATNTTENVKSEIKNENS